MEDYSVPVYTFTYQNGPAAELVSLPLLATPAKVAKRKLDRLEDDDVEDDWVSTSRAAPCMMDEPRIARPSQASRSLDEDFKRLFYPTDNDISILLANLEGEAAQMSARATSSSSRFSSSYSHQSRSAASTDAACTSATSIEASSFVSNILMDASRAQDYYLDIDWDSSQGLLNLPIKK